MTLLDVNLWGRRIGAARQEAAGMPAVFEWDPDFLASPVEPSPIVMPKRPGTYEFPALPSETFRGLPGLLWDSLPDRFGLNLIRRWHRAGGQQPESLNALEMLAYVGARGMGALEYAPAIDRPDTNTELDVARLAQFAALAVPEDNAWSVDLSSSEGVEELLEVGTSAGGARPKAIIGWNRDTNAVRSGRVDLADGFEYWLLKFDGIHDDSREIGATQGYGAVEYAYSLLARAAGIEMTECHLFEESGRRHFMTRRFDRTAGGQRLHMQTLAGIGHFDFNVPGAASYEDAFSALQTLRAKPEDFEQQFRRMVFNVVFRNQDDHPKNISFLMERSGTWSLAPAYDISFAFNPSGEYTARHQMSINGKLEGFERLDLEALARGLPLVRGRWSAIVDEVIAAASQWRGIAEEVEIPRERARQMEAQFRLRL